MTLEKQLHGDLVHSAPITGSQAILDTNTIVFCNEQSERIPLVSYEIVDGKLVITIDTHSSIPQPV